MGVGGVSPELVLVLLDPPDLLGDTPFRTPESGDVAKG